MKDYVYYFSGLETGIDTTEAYFKAGRKIKGGMFSFLTFKGNKTHSDWLKRFRANYGGKVMIDSGAHAFVYAENIEAGTIKEGWHPVNSQVAPMLKNPALLDAYVKDYMDWLEANRDAYDYAVEMDIQKVVGQEKVDEWREEFLKRKIPLVIVLHPRAGDSIDTLKTWKAKGVTYFGRGEFDKENPQDMKMLREMSAEGVKVHIFAFSPTDLGQFLDYIDSSDSSSWLAAGKLAQLMTAKGRRCEGSPIKESPIMLRKAVQVVTADGVVSKEEVDKMVKEKKYLYLNWYNMFEMQKWIDTLTHKPAYAAQLASAESGETNLPAWVNEKDKFGRPKSIYLQARFNNYKSGVYAKEIQKHALMCNNCVVKDTCPVFQADALCYFTPYWKRLGGKTRNKEAIVGVLAELVGDMHERLERGRYFEDQAGGMIDKSVSQLENDLVKTLEVLNRVVNGSGQGLGVGILNQAGGKIAIGGDIDKALIQIRGEFGDALADKITRRAKLEAVPVEGEVVEEKVEEIKAEEALPEPVI